MTESTERSSAQPSQPEQPASSETTPIDARELVYRGGYSGNPRELIENPAVTPELVEQAPEDIRDDLMPKGNDNWKDCKNSDSEQTGA